jgi:hypothetical protein
MHSGISTEEGMVYERRVYRCRGEVVARRLERTTAASSSGRDGFIAEAGDWIVEAHDERIVLPDGWFRALFVPAPEEDPVGWS